MITRVTPENRVDFFCRLGADLQQGARVGALFACYEAFEPLCAFYLAGKGAALAVAGGTALVAGPVYPGEEDELNAFLAFLGVGRCEAWDYAPAFLAPKSYAAMVYRGGASPPMPPGLTFEGAPPLAGVEGLLQACGLLEGDSAFYADACTRRNRGLVRACALRNEEGALVATAGIYASFSGTGYLSCVATLPAYRGRGAAAFLAARLGTECGLQRLWLSCLPSLVPVYARGGFVPDGSFTVSTAPG